MKWEIRIAAVEATSIGLPFVATVVSVKRKARKTKKGAEDDPETEGERLFVCTIPEEKLTPKMLARLIRSHWGIENKNHWRRDAMWGEDTPWHRNSDIAQTLSLMRGALLAVIAEPLPTTFARSAKYSSAALAILERKLACY